MQEIKRQDKALKAQYWHDLGMEIATNKQDKVKALKRNINQVLFQV